MNTSELNEKINFTAVPIDSDQRLVNLLNQMTMDDKSSFFPQIPNLGQVSTDRIQFEFYHRAMEAQGQWCFGKN